MKLLNAFVVVSLILACSYYADDSIEAWLEKQPIKVGEKLLNQNGFYGKGFTLMHIAAMDGRVDVMQWLKEKGEDIDTKCESHGFTPMLLAAFNPRFLAFMLQPIRFKNQDDFMNFAAREYNLEAIKWLKEQGADVKAKTNDGSTLMHIAAASFNADAMKWAHNQGIDLNAKNNSKKTVLDLANESLVQFQRINIHEQPELVGNIIIRAIVQDAKECIKWLEENGAVSGEQE